MWKSGVFMSLTDIFFLYLAFRAKQVICDFFLQTSWMYLAKCSPFNKGGAKALFAHSGIHATFTFILTQIFAPEFWWLGIVDFVLHSIIDKGKAMINSKMNWTYNDTFYWWTFGIDQEAHNLTHLAYIIIIVISSGTALY